MHTPFASTPMWLVEALRGQGRTKKGVPVVAGEVGPAGVPPQGTPTDA